MQSIFRLDLVARAWANFLTSVAASWQRAVRVYRASAVLLAGVCLAVAALLGELALWGAFILFMPHGHALGAYANTLLTPTTITRAALAILHNRTGIARNSYREYTTKFGVAPKIGTAITIRKPVQFEVTSGAGLSVQDISEPSTTLTVSSQKHVDFAFQTSDLTLTIEEFTDRYLRPAIARLASEIDKDLGTLYSSAYFSTGTPGTTPNASSFFTNSQRKLDDTAAPDDGDRRTVLNPAAHWSMMAAMPSTSNIGFNPRQAQSMGDDGEFTRDFFGLMMDRSQSIPSHTTGVFTTSATPLTNGAGADGDSTLVTDGWNASSSTVKQGDVFTIADVYQVNPETKVSTGVLQQFVVTADGTSSSGNLTISISPTIRTTGPYQNVNSAPADGKALTFIGTENTEYPQNFVMHRHAIALANVPLEMPNGVDFKAQEQFEGFNLRVLRAYDINTDRVVCRVDTLYGYTLQRPEFLVRLWG